jgi:hypothetical protein
MIFFSSTHTNSKQQKNKMGYVHIQQQKSKIAKLFQDTKLKSAYCTENTIENSQTDKYKKTGIYQVKCLDYQYIHRTKGESI